VDQRIGRGEDEGGLTRAEHLVGDLDAVPLDEAFTVRISRPHVPSSPVFLFLTRPVAAGLQRHCNPPAQSGRDGIPNTKGSFIMAIDSDKLNEFLGKFVGT
jgi:hypothetical protein